MDACDLPRLALYMGFSSPSRKLPVGEKWIPVAKKGMKVAPWTMKNVPVLSYIIDECLSDSNSEPFVHTVCEEECAGECIPDNPFSNTAKDLNHSTKEDKRRTACIP